MQKKILIISSLDDSTRAIYSILNNLSDKFDFYFLGSRGNLYNFFTEKNWPRGKIFLFKNILRFGAFKTRLFFIFKPLIQIYLFSILLVLKYKKKYQTIILVNINEKILISPLAKFLKIKVLWLESRDLEYSKLNKKIIKTFSKLARKNKIICLNSFFQKKIEKLGIATDNIEVISPGIKKQHKKYQETLFSKLAKNENNQVGRKFYTIGTITDLNDKEKIETLFSALKNSVDLITRVQLIIVGTGAYSPDNNPWAKWLAKKMGIETMVWFVTDTKNIKKWLDSFDIFVISSRFLNLDDFKNTLYAMESELAPIVPYDLGYEDLVIDGENGFFYDINKSETLTENIIKYYKNKRLSIDLGKNAREHVEKNFQIEKSLEKIKELL